MSPSQASAEQLKWEQSCSPHITSDVIWHLDAYRSALFALHCVKVDSGIVQERPEVRDQLIRAAGGIGASISEGYSRSTHADRLRYYDYALGSARECVVWYLGLEDRIAPEVLNERLALLSRCRALVMGMIRSSRTNRMPKRPFER